MPAFFNNSTTRTLTVAFMDFFTRIQIEKYRTLVVNSGNQLVDAETGAIIYDDTTGSFATDGSGANSTSTFVQRKIKPVPVQWAAREKFVELIRSSSARRQMDPAQREKNPVEMQWILPRISCFLTGFNYDTSRRLIKTQQLDNYSGNSTSVRTSAYTPTPINLTFEVATIARHIDDSFQILEQIVPYFSPTMNIDVKLFPDKEADSIPITLDSVNINIPTDLNENEERIFTNVFTFTMKTNYYIQSKSQGLINNIAVKLVDLQNVFEIDVAWVEAQNKITKRFQEYIDTSLNPNPFN